MCIWFSKKCVSQKEGFYMNDVIKAMIERRSVRSFKPDMPPQEIVDEIINAGLYAASGMGKQNPIIIAVTNKELRDKLSIVNRKIAGWDEKRRKLFL